MFLASENSGEVFALLSVRSVGAAAANPHGTRRLFAGFVLCQRPKSVAARQR